LGAGPVSAVRAPAGPLTGFGGAGKTRLSLEVASGLVDAYLDGVRFVELTALADPLLVPYAVASAFDDIGEQSGRPPDRHRRSGREWV
jgi:predicted ATPase